MRKVKKFDEGDDPTLQGVATDEPGGGWNPEEDQDTQEPDADADDPINAFQEDPVIRSSQFDNSPRQPTYQTGALDKILALQAPDRPQHSTLDKVLAGIVGLGAGGGAQGVRATREQLDQGYNDKLQDFRNQLAILKEGVGAEEGLNRIKERQYNAESVNDYRRGALSISKQAAADRASKAASDAMEKDLNRKSQEERWNADLGIKRQNAESNRRRANAAEVRAGRGKTTDPMKQEMEEFKLEEYRDKSSDKFAHEAARKLHPQLQDPNYVKGLSQEQRNALEMALDSVAEKKRKGMANPEVPLKMLFANW